MKPVLARNLIPTAALALIAALHPAALRADDGARINNVESELQRLRTQVAEQDRRIQRLEAQLEQRATVSPDYSPGRRPEPAVNDSPPTSGPLPWHSPETWDRVAIGMPQQEVVTILGEPTAVEAVDNYKTLFYSDGAAGGSRSGHVNLKDDNVVAIKPPGSR